MIHDRELWEQEHEQSIAHMLASAGYEPTPEDEPTQPTELETRFLLTEAECSSGLEHVKRLREIHAEARETRKSWSQRERDKLGEEQ